MSVTREQVAKYMWPHFDFGKEQSAAYGQHRYSHGDVVEFRYVNPETGEVKTRNATFRLLDAGLYRDEWMKEALPIAKELWAERKAQEKDKSNG